MKIKKWILSVLVAGVVALPWTLRAGITNSDHDFSNQGWSGGEVCIVCHTPHGAISTELLWNRENSVGPFTPYDSPTLDATVGTPDGSSRLCLSCHDGTIALENFGGVTTGSNFVTGDDRIGQDLRTEHPISFTYNAALATEDGSLYNPEITNSGLGGTITSDLLQGTKLQCSSCHDVHDIFGNNKLLRITTINSALCLTCHNK